MYRLKCISFVGNFPQHYIVSQPIHILQEEVCAQNNV